MYKVVEKLQCQLEKCRLSMKRGYMSTMSSGIEWLDGFCEAFLEFTNGLHGFFDTDLNISAANEHEQQTETIYLCLTQIVVCIKCMERTIKAEDAGRVMLSATRQHFLDRIHWCLDRLHNSLAAVIATSVKEEQLPGNSFVEVMDIVLDHLSPYSSYAEDSLTNSAAESEDVIFDSKQIRSSVDLLLGYILAFANVALQLDKLALSALCQKALRECIGFQEDCALDIFDANFNLCNRKLKAIGLENALCQLENYINDALLRLIYTSFLDYDKLSIEKLRTAMRLCESDDPVLDELIADFDVNVDRTMQIGVLAVAFAPNKKMKIKVRSSLASLECLDTCLIPSLQAGASAGLHSEILEQHFNEEVGHFKNAIQEIIDSHAFTACYQDMLSQCILQVEKQFNKAYLEETVLMGEFLRQHFLLEVNHTELLKETNRLQCFQRYTLMLRECRAILMCANQVDTRRIMKRFKILRSVLKKFSDSLRGSSARAAQSKTNVFLMSSELTDSQHMFESIGISPSICSILYQSETHLRRRRTVSDSLKGNYSKLPQTPLSGLNAIPCAMFAACDVSAGADKLSNAMSDNGSQGYLPERRCSLRRKESLRTTMFKRQKLSDTERVYNVYRNASISLQISEILDQLSFLSSKVSNSHHSQKHDTSN